MEDDGNEGGDSSIFVNLDQNKNSPHAAESGLANNEEGLIVIEDNPLRSWGTYFSLSIFFFSLSIATLVIRREAWHVVVTLLFLTVAFLWRVKREVHTFNVDIKSYTLCRWHITGKVHKRFTFDDISRVSLEEYNDTQGGTETNFFLTLISGKKIKLLSNHLIGLENEFKRACYARISKHINI